MWPWILTALGIVAAWLYALSGLLVAPAPILVLCLVVWLVYGRRWKPLAALVVASPLAFSAGWGALSYAMGSARFHTIGYPDVRFYNVERSTRLQTVSSGCIVHGGEWMLDLPNNLVVTALSFLLGPMPGAYDGPYPSDMEVDEAFRAAVAVTLSDIKADRVRVGARDVRLRAGVGKELLATLPASHVEARGAGATLWQGRVLLLRFPGLEVEGVVLERPVDVLFDSESGKILAYRGFGLSWDVPTQWT